LDRFARWAGFTPYPVMSALNHLPEDFGAPKKRLEAAE
jgi:formate dehydrogenase iron-sulfur subunit